MPVAGILTYDTVLTFRDEHYAWGHMGLGTLLFLVNIALIWRTRCPATPVGTSWAAG